ncbi:MAG: hypothetical protein ACRD03_02885 [Acidimicrobiales bacterium]
MTPAGAHFARRRGLSRWRTLARGAVQVAEWVHVAVRTACLAAVIAVCGLLVLSVAVDLTRPDPDVRPAYLDVEATP